MPVGTETSRLDGNAGMNGTTLCPRCDTRFKIAEAQLEAHHGMVRCGYCLQAFDARPGYIPDQPSPQLELPILNELAPLPEFADETPPALAKSGKDVSNENELPDTAQNEALSDTPLQPMTLAEQVAIVQDEDDSKFHPERRTWPWTIAAFLSLLVLIAQTAYFFRVDLAARLPGLKPALISYCQLLKCTVPLPQNANLMSIESSDLEANPAHENQITLNVLLRNRAPYSQAFPNLELTLNDIQDNALARRVFRPADYLPPIESETLGLLPHHEIGIRLNLDTTDIKPSGYRLALTYPRQ